jgi:hypothetical protein
VEETTQHIALTVREKVERPIKSLNIHVAETGISVGVIRMYAFLPLLHFTPPRHSDSCSMGRSAVETPVGGNNGDSPVFTELEAFSADSIHENGILRLS